MRLRNVSRNRFSDATGSLDLEFENGGEWIPITISPKDTTPLNARLLVEVQRQRARGTLTIADYQPQELPSAEEALTDWRARARCSRFQAKAALHNAGLLTAADAAVAAADDLTKMAWADATEFRRNSPTIAAIGAALGLADAEIDDLFNAAIQIEI